jgi:hypothetical protein
MSAFTPKANIGPQSLHVRSGSLADIPACPHDVRFTPNSDINRCSGIWAFAPGDERISLQVGTPSGSYVRVMKDRLATIYAKVLSFSTRPFKNEF